MTTEEDAEDVEDVRWLTLPDGWAGIPSPPRPGWAAQLDRTITAAEDAAAWLAGLPRALQRRLVISTVRCPGGEVLLRLYRLPDTSPFARAAGRHFLAVPTRRARQRDGRPTAPMWVVSMRDTWALHCRCHREQIVVTAADLPGGTSVPGASVVLGR